MTDEETTTGESTAVTVINTTASAVEKLTDNLVTFAVVGTIMYMIATGVEIPQWVQTIVAMIFAFYYKSSQ